MSDNKYLNQQHREIIENYILYVKKLIYFATEDAGDKKFKDFLTVLDTVFLYSNNFHDSIKERTRMNEEFIFLIPNMTFYLSVGFLTGLKHKQNNEEMQEFIDRMAKKSENITGELADLLIDSNETIEILQELNN
jgi:hypothetical protein|tara:strand:+ start:1940 stop:2344 length:405 start_codon:yes stop_codon:yes gene_type:complete